MSGIQCIGRMVWIKGDWYAELDFENGESTIKERGTNAMVATVPMGEWVPETEDHSAELDPECPQAKRLCKIVFAPEAWRLLSDIQERLIGCQSGLERLCDEIVDDIGRTLECLNVPGRGE